MGQSSMVRLLKEHGLKVTEARLAILNLLNQDAAHFSAEQILAALQEKGQDIGVATVYRVLAQLEEAGLLEKHHFSDKRAWYELHSHAHHDHMVCDQCGEVIEFCDDLIESQQQKVAEAHGFVIHSHQLTLFGLCQSCSESKVRA